MNPIDVSLETLKIPLPPVENGSARVNSSLGLSGKSVEEASREMVEFERGMPRPDLAEILADCRWIENNWAELSQRYSGTSIAVVAQKVEGSSPRSVHLQLDVARRLHVHPERVVVSSFPTPSVS